MIKIRKKAKMGQKKPNLIKVMKTFKKAEIKKKKKKMRVIWDLIPRYLHAIPSRASSL